jgi:hypothetical protein
MRLFCGFLGALLGGGFGFLVGATICFALPIFGKYSLLALPLGPLFGLIGGGFGGRRFADFWQSEATRRQRFFVVGGLLLWPAMILSGLMVAIYLDRQPPSDKEMITHFQKHRNEFDQLVAMVQNDPGLENVTLRDSTPPLPPERVATYQKLLKAAGVPRGVYVRKEAGAIEFTYWYRGSALSNTYTKGFFYYTEPAKKADFCTSITGNWYLGSPFYQG